MKNLRTALAVSAVLALSAGLAGPVSGAGSTYKGKVGADKSQKLTFKVSRGKVRKWTAVIYASCFTGNMLTTVTIPATKIGAEGRFKRRYQPVKSSETYVTVRGKISGGTASGTVKETGACSFGKVKWSARRK